MSVAQPGFSTYRRFGAASESFGIAGGDHFSVDVHHQTALSLEPGFHLKSRGNTDGTFLTRRPGQDLLGTESLAQ